MNPSSPLTESSFQVEGIHCGSCVRRIQRTLGPVAGLDHVEVLAASGEVRVRHDQSLASAEQIAQRLKEAGFPPRA